MLARLQKIGSSTTFSLLPSAAGKVFPALFLCARLKVSSVFHCRSGGHSTAAREYDYILPSNERVSFSVSNNFTRDSTRTQTWSTLHL